MPRVSGAQLDIGLTGCPLTGPERSDSELHAAVRDLLESERWDALSTGLRIAKVRLTLAAHQIRRKASHTRPCFDRNYVTTIS